jgi:Fe-S cluster assembly iron-binding protein IscA
MPLAEIAKRSGSMLTVTIRARDVLHDLLVRTLEQQQGLDNGTSLGFRLVPGREEESQLGLALDQPRPGDAVVEHDGRSVLIVDNASAELLTHLTLDVAETPEGTKLALREAAPVEV